VCRAAPAVLGGAGPHTGAVPLQQVKGSTRAEVRKQLPGLLVAEQPEGPLPKWAVAVGGEALGHLENCSCLWSAGPEGEE
jgi:hypothetical protein